MDHVAALQQAFPGVWMRADGAFVTECRSIRWAPGDVEGFAEIMTRYETEKYGGNTGLLVIGHNELTGSPNRLRLSQLRALINYIDALSAPPKEEAA